MNLGKPEFQLNFLGKQANISMLPKSQRSPQMQIIDQIESAQLEELLPLNALEKDQVVLNLSKHGLKILDLRKKDILERQPLQNIAEMFIYNDGLGRCNLAVLVGEAGKNFFNYLVFQCLNQDQGEHICKCMQEIFSTVTLLGKEG